MCGIAGLLGAGAAEHVDAMVDALAHRGPDGRGTHVEGDVALGASRLAIVDVAGGAQPFEDGRLALVANAEIYNHLALRADLERSGARFRSHCDAEVILHAYRRWGPACVGRLHGFFAFALWDGEARRLLLGRDPFGIAPLVWARRPGGGLAFASEVKALLRVPGVRTALDPGALDDLLAMRWVGGPRTFWRGVEHLPAGHLLVAERGRPPRVERWYTPPAAGSSRWSAREAAERLHDALEHAVERRLQGEVPVGLYLSGGLDSSVLAALLARRGRPVPTFSHGWDRALDETPEAELVARHTRLPWHEIRMVPDDLDALPDIVRAIEQPVANSDLVGLWVLAREAARSVTVVLSGEGADELLGSYPHQQVLSWLDRLPHAATAALGEAVARAPEALVEQLSAYAGVGRDPEARRRVAGALRARDLPTRYGLLTALFTDEERRALYTPDALDAVRRAPGRREAIVHSLARVARGRPVLDRLIDLKLDGWLEGYHLGRANRIAMAHGLEGRYPFLDLEVAEHVIALPAALKSGLLPPREKRVLRHAAEGLLPPGILARPKGPVRVPLALFRGRFEALARDLLTPERVRARGLFRPEAVERLLAGLDGPAFVRERQVFALVLVELWHDVFRAGAP